MRADRIELDDRLIEDESPRTTIMREDVEHQYERLSRDREESTMGESDPTERRQRP
jgi:hypothetical protein